MPHTQQAPSTSRTRDLIEVPAIIEPHQGTSYNPPVEAHQELLEKAVSVEEKRLKDAEKLAELKAKMESARLTQEDDGEVALAAAGMTVQDVQEGDEAAGDKNESSAQQSSVKRISERKTKAQRNKAARALAEVCLSFPSSHHRSQALLLAETCSGRKGGAETPPGVHQQCEITAQVHDGADDGQRESTRDEASGPR